MEVPPTATSGWSQSSKEEEEVSHPSRRSSGGVGGEMDLGRIFGESKLSVR